MKKVSEAKTVQLLRKYSERPEIRVQNITPVRNKILTFVKENEPVSREELKEYIKTFNEESGRNTSFAWVRRNSNLFRIVKENGEIKYSLSKLGRRVIERTNINENIIINDNIYEKADTYSDILIKNIAKKLEVDLSKYDLEQIKIGMAIEIEHGSKLGDIFDIGGDEPEIAFKIALAHLEEEKDYYIAPKEVDWALKELEKESKENDHNIDITNIGYAEYSKNSKEKLKPKEESNKPLKDGLKSNSRKIKDYDNFKYEEDEEEIEDENSICKRDLTKEEKDIIIQMIDKHIAGELPSGENEYDEVLSGLDCEKEELLSCIYKNAYITLENSIEIIDVELKDEIKSAVDDLLSSKRGEITLEMIKELASKFNEDYEKVENYIYLLAKEELKIHKLTKNNFEYIGECVATLQNTPGMGNAYLPGSEINDVDNKDPEGSGDEFSPLIFKRSKKRKFLTKRISKFDDFINHVLQQK